MFLPGFSRSFRKLILKGRKERVAFRFVINKRKV